MRTETITVELLKRLRAGDDRALEKLYFTVRQRFLDLALSFLKDPHEAQAAFDDAFMKFQTDDSFVWQGEPKFYRYFATIVENECRNSYRRNKKQGDWEREHFVSLTHTDDNDTVVIEYVEIAIGYNPEVEEAEMRRRTRIQKEFEEYLAELTPQERRLLEAYQALVETPGSDQWGDHEKTAFLKSYLELPESAFYPAHSRFKKKLEPLARRLGLLR